MMRMGRTLASVCLAACVAVVGAGLAFGDIKGFNAAVQAGDYRKAAAEAKTAWPAWDKSDPDTAIVAREFGFASYVAGDFAAAREYGIFLRDNGKTLPTPDDQPVSSAVLLAAAEFRLGANDTTRAALLNALKAREGQTGIDNLSVLAAEALYKFDWSKSDWAKASETGDLAWRLLDRAGIQLALRALDARAAGAAAGFLGGPDKDDYDRIVDTHDAVIAAIDAADPARRIAFAPLKYQLEAWAISTALYFKAADQIGSNIPIRVKERKLKIPAQPIFAEESTEKVCKGDPQWPDMQYPQAAAYRGMIGTVVLRIEIDAQGRPVSSETLAAVPARHFAKTVEEAVPKMTLRRAKDDPPGCTLAQKSMITYFTFRML